MMNVALHKSGSSVGIIARQFGVSRASVHTVIHKFNNDKDCLDILYLGSLCLQKDKGRSGL